MSNEGNNITSWRNWGDHPLFVLLSAIGIIIGIIFGILSYYKSDKPSVEENTTINSNSDSNSPRKNIPKDLAFGIYIDEKIEEYGNFSKKFETVIMESKPKKVSIINLRKHSNSVWAATPEDFYFDWESWFFFPYEKSPKETFRKMFEYMATGFESSNCASIYDLKRRIAKDNYQKNILITNNISSCNNVVNSNLEIPSDKKVLVLLVANSSDNSTWFNYAEESLKKVFPNSQISPFVSIMENQLTDFLQSQ